MSQDLHYDAAKEIVSILKNKGYVAYFVGGYVRDKLLNLASSDIDIVSSASPQEIQRLFEKTIPVGIQFGIIIIVHKGFSFEVAQFREEECYTDGRHPEKVKPSEEKSDAQRRDFTINGLFFDPITEEIKDYVEGLKDIQTKTLKAIGEPKRRFEEDRLRMLRAARYLAVYLLNLDESTKKAILEMAPVVKDGLSIERIYQELVKMHEKNALASGLKWLLSLNLLVPLFPALSQQTPSLLFLKISKLEKIKSPSPLIFFLAYLFDLKTKEDLETFIKALKAPNSELNLGMHFLSFMNEKHLSSLKIAELYSYNFYPALLEFMMLDHSHPSQFLNALETKRKDLEKVTALLIQKKGIVTADELIKHHIPKGPLIKEGLLFAMNLYAENPDLSQFEILQMTLMHLKTSLS